MHINSSLQGRMKGCGLFRLLVRLAVCLGITVFLGLAGAQHIYGYTAVKGTVTVKSGKARKEPSTKSAFVFGVIKDETVVIIGEEKGSDGTLWYKVKVLNSVGYLRSNLVKKTNIEVKSESTNDADKSASSSASAGTAGSNSATNGTNSSSSSGTSSNTNSPCVKGSNVIVREEASTKSGIRIVVQNGLALTILQTVKGADGKDWHNVAFTNNGRNYKGFIRSDLVSLTGGASNSSTGSTNNAESTAGGNSTGDGNSGNSSADSSSSGSGAQVGKIKGTGVNIRKSPVDGSVIGRLTSGDPITVTKQERAEADGNVWYFISFVYNKKPMTGYVRSDLTEGITMDSSVTGDNSGDGGDSGQNGGDGNSGDGQNGDNSNGDGNSDGQNGDANGSSGSQQTGTPTASIKGTGVRIREKVVTGNVITSLDTGYPIEILEEVSAADGYKWYKIRFSKNDKEREGYVRSDLVSVVNSSYSSALSDADFEKSIEGFPETYKPSLRALHEKYPQWQFTPVNTGLEWKDVVSNESRVGKNLVAKTSIASWKSTEPQAYDWTNNTWYGFDGGSWAAASTELIQYYLDPRNFLDDSGIFQFETLGFEDYHNVEGVRNVLSGTFMSGDYTDADGNVRNYAQTFFDAGQNYGVNPYHLASKAVQEQGVNGKSQSISGNVSGLENLFNYFNIGAYAANGRTATINGLYYAAGGDENYLRPWNTRCRSIFGASKYIADKYVAVGQNTLYFQKFNVVNKTNGLYQHQYMSNVVGASYESARMRKAYSDLNTKLVFRIPVYNNMPATNCIKPTSDSNPNTYLSNLWVDGYSFTMPFSSINSTYYLTVPNNVTSINVGASTVSGSSSVGGTGAYNLNVGENRLQVVCKAQNGATKGYNIIVIRQ